MDNGKTAQQIFAHSTTATLCDALEQLAGRPALTRAESTASTELINEIERRIPVAERAVAELFEANPDADPDADRADYIRVLLAKARAELERIAAPDPGPRQATGRNREVAEYTRRALGDSRDV